MRGIRLGITILGLATTLAGCGGGGGGSSAPQLRYTTDWSASDGGTVTGVSQRVALLTLNGTQVESVVLNKPGATTQDFLMHPPTSGKYVLRAELFTLPNLGGTRSGVIEAQLSVSGATTFRSSVGTPPLGVSVTPASASFPFQTSRQFYANATAAAGVATFVPPDSFTWQAFGGHASINDAGLAFGESEGSGSIRATQVDTSLFSSATYNVQPFNATTGKWTILVYMNAANDLYPYSTLNVNQMEKVAQNSNVRFVVQWKQSQAIFPGSTFNGTRRYLVQPDTSTGIVSQIVQDMGSGVDMGRPETLLNFINWGKTLYPADHYCLVVWNHGNGWRARNTEENWTSRAVSYDDETGNSIQIWELGQAFGSNHFDIVAWDASLMQMLEVAYEISDQATFVAGSEESPPGEGYPYDLVFAPFRDTPDATPRNLSKAFVDGMLAVPEYSTRKITQSVLETSKLGDLATALSGLGSALTSHQASLGTIVPQVRSQAQSYSPTSLRVYRDLIDTLDRLDGNTGFSDIETAIDSTRLAAQNAIVWEGHNSHSAGSKGISIDFSSGTTFSNGGSSYALMKLGQLTQWDEWLTVAP